MRKNKKIKSYLPPYRRYLKYLLKFFRFVAVAGSAGAAKKGIATLLKCVNNKKKMEFLVALKLGSTGIRCIFQDRGACALLF